MFSLSPSLSSSVPSSGEFLAMAAAAAAAIGVSGNGSDVFSLRFGFVICRFGSCNVGRFSMFKFMFSVRLVRGFLVSVGCGGSTSGALLAPPAACMLLGGE